MFLMLGIEAANATVAVGGAEHTIATGIGGPVGVAVDSKGNIYVGSFGDPTAGCVLKYAAGTYTQSELGCYGDGIQQLAIDSSDNLYITAFNWSSDGEIYVYSTTSGSVSQTIDIGSLKPFAIAVDGSGNIWTANSATLYEITSGSSTYTDKSSLVPSGVTDIWGLAFDASGNMWMSDYHGGTAGSGAVYRLDAGGFSTSHKVISSLNSPAQLQFDATKNMYVASKTDNAVYKYPYSTSNTYGFSSSTSYPMSTTMTGAEAEAFDSDGNLFLTGHDGGTLAELSTRDNGFGAVAVGSTSATLSINFDIASGTTVGSFAVLDQGVSGLEFSRVLNTTTDCTTGTYSSAKVCQISADLTPNTAGARYGSVEVLDNSGNVLATAYIHGTGTAPMLGFSPGTVSVLRPTGLTQSLNGPRRPAFDANGNLYVADYANGRVIKIDSNGAATTVSTGSVTLSNPAQVAVDGAGNLYIANSGSGNVVKVTPSGTGTTLDNNGLTLSNNVGVAVDGAGNVYASDRGSTKRVVLFPSDGTGAYALTITGLGDPTGLATDGSNNLFIADYGNKQILKYSSTGTTSTVGTGSVTLSGPASVSVDSPGNIYVSDVGANTVVEIPADNSADTTALSTGSYTLNYPDGVTISSTGKLYIMDTNNARILLSDQTTAPSFSFAATPIGDESSDSPQTLTLLNLGNSDLTFRNTTIGADFQVESSCLTVSDSTSQTLAANSSCALSLEFIPATGGSHVESIVLTDDNNNTSGVTQTIALSGAAISQLGFQTKPTSEITAGDSTGSVVVQEEDSTGSLISSATDTITLTVTYPDSSTKSYQAAATGGVATFSAHTLTLAGSYKYVASISDVSSVTTSSATETVDAAAASSIAVSGSVYSTQRGTIGAANVFTFPVAVSDIYGNAVSGETVSYAVSTAATGATATLSANSATSGANGLASVTGSANGYVGSYTVTATIAGVGSANFTLNNTQGSVKVTLSASPTSPTTYGATTKLSVSVTNLNGVSTVPSGSITFYANGGVLNTVTMTSGAASYSTVLSVGVYTNVYASYSGDTNFTTNTSATSSYSVNQATPAINVLPTASAIMYGQNLALSVLTGSATNPNNGVAVAGSFAWVDGTVQPTAGTHTYAVTFTPNDAASYTTTTASATVTVIDLTVGSTGNTPSGSTTGSSTSTGSTITEQANPGDSISVTLSISSSQGITLPVATTLTVSGVPVGVTTSLAGAGWRQTSSTSWTYPAGVQLTNPQLAFSIPAAINSARTERKPGVGAKVLPLTFCLILLPFAKGMRRNARRMMMIALAAAISLTAITGMTGCNANNGFFAQSPKDYTVTITLTAGTVTKVTTMNLTVN